MYEYVVAYMDEEFDKQRDITVVSDVTLSKDEVEAEANVKNILWIKTREEVEQIRQAFRAKKSRSN